MFNFNCFNIILLFIINVVFQSIVHHDARKIEYNRRRRRYFYTKAFICCSQFILKRGLSLTSLTFSRDRQCKLLQYDALLTLERDRRLSIVAQYLIVCCPHKIPSQVLTNSCHGNKYCGLIGTI